jgi:hypothetical protein
MLLIFSNRAKMQLDFVEHYLYNQIIHKSPTICNHPLRMQAWLREAARTSLAAQSAPTEDNLRSSVGVRVP